MLVACRKPAKSEFNCLKCRNEQETRLTTLLVSCVGLTFDTKHHPHKRVISLVLRELSLRGRLVSVTFAERLGLHPYRLPIPYYTQRHKVQLDHLIYLEIIRT